MAEPTNTPMPPSTPVASPTPRSSSPAPPLPSFAAANFGSTTPAALRSPPAGPEGKKPLVLHVGDAIKYNPETYAAFSAQCEIIRPSTPERSQPEFVRALKEKRWGDFNAIFRPFWGTGGEMGQWDAELVSLLPTSMRVFASAGAGFDWADTKLLGERGIIYCNSGLAAAEAVADFAVAMIISTFRHLPWCMTAATGGSDADFQDCHGRATGVSRNLRGQVLGLIGLGNIGQQIAVRCGAGFAMDIHYYDVDRKPAELESEMKATFHVTLESLLRESDCVVLCTPAGGKLITAASLACFKRGARFVNVARGSLVDEDALADAMDSEHISTIALDVHASEPRPHPRLVKYAGTRAMLTCHNAGGTVDTHKGFEELSMRNIMAVLSGGAAITPVNLHYLRH